MKWLNYITLLHRAYRYKYKHDIGGIHFLLQHTKHGDIAFDIGAHKGGYLYWMQKQIGVRGKAVAFEPQRNLYRNLLELRQNFSWNNVTIENLALNDVVEQSQLFIPTTKQSGSSPGARLMADVTTADGRLQSIRTITLDEYCLQNNLAPNFLKIDVEGNEWNVLKGAASVLAKCKPTILIEIEARHVGEDVALNTFEWIEQHGYKGYFLAGKQMLPLSSFSFSKHQNLNNKKAYYNNFGFVPSQNK
ncbi:MAG: FkbM family methyltransferase [Chitinophagales bacterium]|nr:FkbM family methyltransferase [Chitinophagales bacterium]